MATQPSGPPSTKVTAMDWSDVTRFANDVGDLLGALQPLSTDIHNSDTFSVSPGSFSGATTLQSATAKVGNSLVSDYDWMVRLLGDIQTGLNNAVASLSKTDSLQKESGQTLLNDLTALNTDLTNGPSTTSGP
jgi:hypothetical protein